MEFYIKREILKISLALISLWEPFECLEAQHTQALKKAEKTFKNTLIVQLNNNCKEFREGFTNILVQNKQWRQTNKDKPIILSPIHCFTYKIANSAFAKEHIIKTLAKNEWNLVTSIHEQYEIIKFLERQTLEIEEKYHRLTGPIQIYNQRKFKDEVTSQILQDILIDATIYAINEGITIKYKNGTTILSFNEDKKTSKKK